MKKFLIALLILTAPLTAYEIVTDTNRLPEAVSSTARTYKIRLNNGIEAYLVSDPRAKKSAAILSVNAGSWQDPDDHPGLAHFLEHMLFMGTKKYPDEASFFEFIKSHGGETNAFTEDQYTSYVFDVATPAFPEALERFSQFFAAPLLKPSGLKREVHAVDQEFSGKSRENIARRLMIYKNYGHSDHPFRRFTFGSADSLARAGQKELREWFEKHYSADSMRLVLHSPLPVDELARLANDNFLPIENRDINLKTSKAPLISSSLKGKMLHVEPLENERSLILLWEVPSKFAGRLKSKPDDLLCWILGQEGKSSLLEALRDQGLALELECGASQWDGGHMVFMLALELTKKGVREVDDVVAQIFQTFASIRQSGIPRYLYDDINAIKTLEYQYPEKDTPFKEVVKHSRDLRWENLESYPEQTTTIQNYDPGLALELLGSLTPQDMILDLLADPSLTGVSFDKIEKWAGTRYAIENVPPGKIEKWSSAKPHPNAGIPRQNPYIPENLTLETVKEKTVWESTGGKLALVPDNYFNTPRISWTILIKTPSVNRGAPLSSALSELLIRSVKKELSPYSYEAKVAGLETEIEPDDFGIKITLNGYSENAERLLGDILKTLTRADITRERFEDEWNALAQSYRKFETKSPYLQGLDVLRSVIFKRFSTKPEKLEALESVTYEQFEEFASHLFDKTYVEAVFYGNIGTDSSKKAWDALLAISDTPYPPEEQPAKKIALLPDDAGPYYLRERITPRGNALLLFIEDPDFSFKAYAAHEILSAMLSTPFFNELRTKQQTAYIIANLQQEVEKALFQIFLLESHTHAPRDLLARVEHFLESFNQSTIQKEQFESIKTALADKLKTPSESLKKEGEEIAKMFLEHDGDFDWVKKRIAGFDSLSYEDFVEYVGKILGKSNRRRLAALIEGARSDRILDYSEAQSVDSLREKLNYVPEKIQ